MSVDLLLPCLGHLVQSQDMFAAEHGEGPQAQLNAAPCLQAQAHATVL